MGVGVGGRKIGVTVGGKMKGVGDGGITWGVGLGWGVTVGLGVARATGVAVGRGVGKVIGVTVGNRASSSLTLSAMRRSTSCWEGPQAGVASTSAAAKTKLSRHQIAPAIYIRRALTAQQCFLSLKGELSWLASVVRALLGPIGSATPVNWEVAPPTLTPSTIGGNSTGAWFGVSPVLAWVANPVLR